MPLGSSLSNVVSALLLLVWIAAGGFAIRWQRIRAHPLAVASIVLWLLLFLGAAWSTAPWGEAWRNIEKYARLMLVPIVVSLIVDESWRRRALLAWIAAMLLTLALSYLHAVWAFPLARATREMAVGDHYIFKHHITQNVMMSVFALVALAEAVRTLLDREHPARRWLWLGLSVLAAVNVLFFVHGRTGYLTLFIGLILAMLVMMRLRRIALVAPLLLIALALGAMASDTVRQRTVAAAQELSELRDGASLTSIGRRAEFVARSWELIRERPLLGWGTGAYAEQFCRVARSPEWCAVGHYNPHNQFAFLGVQLGLVGIAALVAWLLCALAGIQRLPMPDRIVGLALVGAFSVHALFDSPLYIATESVWYPLHFALITALAWSPADRSASRAMAASNTRSTEGHSGQD